MAVKSLIAIAIADKPKRLWANEGQVCILLQKDEGKLTEGSEDGIGRG